MSFCVGAPTIPGNGQTIPPVSVWPTGACPSSICLRPATSPWRAVISSSPSTAKYTITGSFGGARGIRRSVFGDSDTEVLLALIERHGLTQALNRCHGMFALALWDRREQVLSFARDRFGEKPLYFGVLGQTLLFGSELAALKAHPAWRGRINPDALALYFRHNCVPQPLSIYAGVEQVRPGHIVRARLENGRPALRQFAYWDAVAEWQAGSDGSSFQASPDNLSTSLSERAGQRRRTPDDLRRPARRLPVRRHRLESGRLADAIPRERSGAHLHHRLCRRCLQRSGLCTAGGGAPRYGAHGSHPLRRGSPGSDPGSCRHLWRAVRRFLAVAEPARLPDYPRVGDGGAERGWG